MTSEPTTAQVSEPVRAKRPTLYGALWHTARGIWNISGLYESPIPQDDYEHVAARALCFITIPGDDAPSGWRPASEVTALQTICMACVELSGHDLSERAREILQEISNAARSIPLPTPPGAKP